MEQIYLPESWKSWQIRKMLGEGAYGAVYLAEKTIGSDKSTSAIKIIQINPNDNERLAMSFELGNSESVLKFYEDTVQACIQEIKAMVALKGHPNIVYIEDYAVEEDPENMHWTIYIRMEYLISFPEYMQTHPMTEEEVIRLGTDLCAALSACEKNGIIHRDIKPSNIFVSPATGQFKLGDFGVARRIERTRSVYSAKGTFPYMAPEICYSKPSDHRADIYSLGLVLYHLLNRNREPFVDLDKQIVYMKDRENATTRRLSGEVLPPPVDASPELGKVILKASSYDPDKRYPDAETFKKALEAIRVSIQKQKKGINKKLIWLIPAVAVLGILAYIFIFHTNPVEQKEKPQATQRPVVLPAESIEPTSTDTETILTNTPDPTETMALESDITEPTATVDLTPTNTPEPIVPEVDISDTGIVPIMEGKQLYYHPQTHSCVRIPIREIEKRLEEAGCVFSEEEKKTFEENLKKQFVPEGNDKITNGNDFAEGDKITLAYRPNESFTAFLSQKGYQIKYQDQTFIAVKNEGSSRLRFEAEK